MVQVRLLLGVFCERLAMSRVLRCSNLRVTSSHAIGKWLFTGQRQVDAVVFVTRSVHEVFVLRQV